MASLYMFYSCKDCLGLNSPCGWCNLNKKCSGSSALCRNASHFLQVSSVTTETCDSINSLYMQVSGGNDFTAVCSLLDTPPSGEYTQPVRVAQDLRLATRHLIAPVSHMTSIPHCLMASLSIRRMALSTIVL